MALKITDENYKDILTRDKLVLIDLWAEWCGPCRNIAPIIDELAAEYEGRAYIGKYNVDEEADLSTLHRVRSIPTLLFFKGEKLIDKIVGATTKNEIKSKIESNL
ncbi:MAG: thioredoxin [Bacteroidales bacterium]